MRTFPDLPIMERRCSIDYCVSCKTCISTLHCSTYNLSGCGFWPSRCFYRNLIGSTHGVHIRVRCVGLLRTFSEINPCILRCLSETFEHSMERTMASTNPCDI